MKTLEDLQHPQGTTMVFDYVYSNREKFLQDLLDQLIQSLEDEFNIQGLDGGNFKDMTDEQQFYTFELKGEGMKRTDVYLVPYEEEERIIVEWKFNPIQTGFIIKVKPTTY